MPAVVAFDLATQTGWAIHDSASNSKVPRCGSFRLPKTGPDLGKFLQAFHGEILSILTPLVEAHSAEHTKVVYEQPILPRTAQLVTLRKLYSLAGHLEYICAGRMNCFECSIPKVRKHFLGHNNDGKREELKAKIIAACEERGWTPQNDDEADALATLDYGLHCLHIEGAAPGPLFKEAS